MRVWNVTRGENRILVALKSDGELLDCEAKIVGKQSPTPIQEIYLLEKPLTPEEIRTIQLETTFEGKADLLRKLDRPPQISPEAKEDIENADIIIYGPGTQFSSLLPSYQTLGMTEAIEKSRAKVKAFVTNISPDHDIQSFSAVDLVKNALHNLKSSENTPPVITHAFCNLPYLNGPNYIPVGIEPGGDLEFKGIRFVLDSYENMSKPGVHSGAAVVNRIIDVYEEVNHCATNELSLFVDLDLRPLAVEILLQEFTDLPWQKHFSKVTLWLRSPTPIKQTLPPHLEIKSVPSGQSQSEIKEVQRWLTEERSEYLVTLTGDGEYRLRDVLLAVELLKRSNFASVLGSRVQSRRQFLRSLNAAYGESGVLYYLSKMAAFVLSAFFAVRFRLIFSDLLTGFRAYRRSSLTRELENVRASRMTSPMHLLQYLVKKGFDVAEIPVTYRTFSGFTNVRWRIKRGFHQLMDLVT